MDNEDKERRENESQQTNIPPTPSNTLNASSNLASLFDPPGPSVSNEKDGNKGDKPSNSSASALQDLFAPLPNISENAERDDQEMASILSSTPATDNRELSNRTKQEFQKQVRGQEEEHGGTSVVTTKSDPIPSTPHNTLNNAPNLTNLFNPPASADGNPKVGGSSSGASLQNLFAPQPKTSSPNGKSPPDGPTVSKLNSLFEAPTPASSNKKERVLSEKAVKPIPTSQLNSLFQPPPSSVTKEEDQLASKAGKKSEPTSQLNSLFQPPPRKKESMTNETTALLPSSKEDSSNFYMGSISDDDSRYNGDEESDGMTSPDAAKTKRRQIPDCGLCQPPTYAGSVMFVLYHVVFCLANGSAIIRPHSSRPILGIMAKMTTLGILMSGPFQIIRLGKDIPALYPSVDLFLAPFLARAAASVDASIAERYTDGDYPEEKFFGSYCVLIGIGMFLSGLMLHLGASFKLANLGTFLPYSVLCGFFSAVGVLMWALAFTVDTSGKTWQQVFFSGDSELIMNSLVHHVPSLLMGIAMNRLGPKNPFFVLLLLFATWGLFYLVMFLTDTSLQEAQELRWFWSKEELTVNPEEIPFRVQPLCNIYALFSIGGASVDWVAVQAGLQNMIALAFLYLLRSSIHASALKKNVANLVRRVPQEIEEVYGHNPQDDSEADYDDLSAIVTSKMTATMRTGTAAYSVVDNLRQTVRQVQWSLAGDKELPGGVVSSTIFQTAELDPAMIEQDDAMMYKEVRAKPTKRTLEEIFTEYGFVLYIVAIFGGFGCCPQVATSKTMYAIRADGSAPQFGSILLLLFFFLTDFDVVQYIPKAAFSSLLVLGAVDTLAVWFFNAFAKTLDVTEWLVVPIIVAFSLVIGFLNAVLVGVAISTFVFVGAFFRVGIVKFQATGKDIRSRIERSMEQCGLLNEYGDEIQVLVLQNYLFFGNAAKLCNYIFTMFEEVDVELEESADIPPIPKVLLLDFSLTTGLDTSTVDIFNDIKEKCVENDCKLFLSGLTSRMRKALALGGIKPENHLARNARSVRLFADMDTGLGKAEDIIIQLNAPLVRIGSDVQANTTGRSTKGFHTSLQKIDELHCQNFAESLVDLEPFVQPLELSPGDVLFASDGGIIRDEERGLFFIEYGTLKISRDSTMSLTLNRTRSYGHLGSLGASTGHRSTISDRHARLQSLAKSLGRSKHQPGRPDNFRLARIGPGWVIGTVENASGTQFPGIFTAMTRSRLYHLPFSTLEEMEETNPLLVLKLYKMLSHLMAKKEEISMEHLSTLHTIMSSHANPKLLSSRASSASLGRGHG